MRHEIAYTLTFCVMFFSLISPSRLRGMSHDHNVQWKRRLRSVLGHIVWRECVAIKGKKTRWRASSHLPVLSHRCHYSKNHNRRNEHHLHLPLRLRNRYQWRNCHSSRQLKLKSHRKKVWAIHRNWAETSWYLQLTGRTRMMCVDSV